MVWLFGQVLMMPLRTFVFGMERMLETVRGIQDIAGRGIEAIAGGPVTAQPVSQMTVPQSSDFNQGAAGGRVETASEEKGQEEKRQMDKDLKDDMLKLVRYKILFVKRGYEHAFPEQEDLIPDNIDGSAFTAWKIAEFIQTLGNAEHSDAHRISVPGSWKGLSRRPYVFGHWLTGFPEADKKYLRVYYEVLERYEREIPVSRGSNRRDEEADAVPGPDRSRKGRQHAGYYLTGWWPVSDPGGTAY